MGEVVEAEHVALGKRVVIKILHARLAGRADILDRMRIEAQALAKLSHPNLVQVTDFGHTDDGRAFLVMERLHGRTLRQELDLRRALPCAEAVDIARQILAGLGAAHQAGIIHRDIKPENVFLCDAAEPPRQVKLLDFGFAKVLQPEGDGHPLSPLAFPTREGISVGTPRFFSPEQALRQRVDARTDVYSTGLVLYMLLAGRGPFDDSHSIQGLLQAHASRLPEPPSRYAQQPIPPELDRIVMRALAKRQEDRFPSAAAFSDALAAALPLRAGAPPPTPPTPPGRWAVTEPLLPAASPAQAPPAPTSPPVNAPPGPLPTLSIPTKATRSAAGFLLAMAASTIITFLLATAILLRALD